MAARFALLQFTQTKLLKSFVKNNYKQKLKFKYSILAFMKTLLWYNYHLLKTELNYRTIMRYGIC
jgi:hypothetical protein